MLPRHAVIDHARQAAFPNCPLCGKHLCACDCSPERIEAAEHRHYRQYVRRVAAAQQLRDMEENVRRMSEAIYKAAECRQEPKR